MRTLLTSLGFAALASGHALAQGSESPQKEGILAVPDYSGPWWNRSKLTGDWGGMRQVWADNGVFLDLDWYHAYQGVANGGRRQNSGSAANFDYRLTLDLMRMDLLPGAVVTVRGQSRFGERVNGDTGMLLPVNTYSFFPFGADADGNVDFAITELNWLQFLSEEFGVILGKITTVQSANEFMGGGGKTQFMNFQLQFPAAVAQLAPYSTLAAGALWIPDPSWTASTLLMNRTDSSTTSGFSDIGDGTTWVTTVDYLGSLNELPGGGSFGFYYGFDSEFAQIGGLNISPGTGVSLNSESQAWVMSWSGWQYLHSEEEPTVVDPRDGRQDLEGIGLFAQVGVADEDTNPVSWSVAGGLSGRGTIETRNDDTWGIGYFYNDLQELGFRRSLFASSTSGLETYYDISFTESLSLTLDAQWTQSAFPGIDDATTFAARLNVSF